MENKKILLGVTGGIAIYKTCELVRLLMKNKNQVKVIMTQNATQMISPVVFRTLSRSCVYVDTFADAAGGAVEHISLANWAQAAIIAPATANTIGKIANGIADNLLTTVVMALSESKLLFVAPAMNSNMWDSVFVQENTKKMACRKNCFVVGPAKGELACGASGAGRMVEPAEIFEFMAKKIS